MANIILIVDDCEMYQSALQMLVAKEGFTTEACADGMQAMERIGRGLDGVAAILLDIYMPHIDGISLLGHLRHRYPGLPVFVVSGTEEASDRTAVLNLGANGFIQKPMTEETIAQLAAQLRALPAKNTGGA